MDDKLRLCGIEPESVVDGPGFRFVLFVQGCPHHCPGCHNPQSHPFTGGTVFSLTELYAQIRENPLLKGITFSGGEPFSQPGPLAQLARMVHAIGLDVITYTGYLYEDLLAMENEQVQALLAETDTLIDGPYLEAERDLSLSMRGSRNQRILNLKCSKL